MAQRHADPETPGVAAACFHVGLLARQATLLFVNHISGFDEASLRGKYTARNTVRHATFPTNFSNFGLSPPNAPIWNVAEILSFNATTMGPYENIYE